MTNAEKYLKEGINKEELFLGIANAFFGECSECDIARLTNFFNERIPTLTTNERVILRNICFQPIKDFYIKRINGTLILHNRVDELYDFFAYDHLFQFIKERRRISNRGLTK